MSDQNEKLLFARSTWAWIIFGIGFAVMYPITTVLDDGWWASVAAIAVVALGVFMLRNLANVSVWSFIKQNYKKTAIWLVIYLAIGIVHTFGRWELYVRNWSAEYPKIEKVYLAKEKVGSIAELSTEKKADFQWQYTRQIGPIPQYENYEGMVKRWIGLWPWSFSAWLLSDLVKDVINYIYNSIGGVLNMMADRYLSSLPNLKK